MCFVFNNYLDYSMKAIKLHCAHYWDMIMITLSMDDSVKYCMCAPCKVIVSLPNTVQQLMCLCRKHL